jgi:hypothetical protein
MDKLTEYQRLGEKILKTAELCRKLETEKEKVLPFYQSDPDTAGGAEEGFPEIAVERIEGLKKQKYNEFQLLDQFYKRFNKVLLDRLAIDKQKATLEKENMFFKSLLKQYLDGVSVNDDVMNANNPLLVVNNKVNLNRPPVERLPGELFFFEYDHGFANEDLCPRNGAWREDHDWDNDDFKISLEEWILNFEDYIPEFIENSEGEGFPVSRILSDSSSDDHLYGPDIYGEFDWFLVDPEEYPILEFEAGSSQSLALRQASGNLFDWGTGCISKR